MRAHPSPSIRNNAQSSHALRPHTPTSCGRPPPLRPPASRRANGLTAPHAPPSAPPAAPKRPSTVRIKRASPSATFCLPFIVKSTWNPCAYPRKRSVTPSTCHQNAREASSVVAKMRIERGVCFRRNDRQARRHNRPVARQRVRIGAFTSLTAVDVQCSRGRRSQRRRAPSRRSCRGQRLTCCPGLPGRCFVSRLVKRSDARVILT